MFYCLFFCYRTYTFFAIPDCRDSTDLHGKANVSCKLTICHGKPIISRVLSYLGRDLASFFSIIPQAALTVVEFVQDLRQLALVSIVHQLVTLLGHLEEDLRQLALISVVQQASCFLTKCLMPGPVIS